MSAESLFLFALNTSLTTEGLCFRSWSQHTPTPILKSFLVTKATEDTRVDFILWTIQIQLLRYMKLFSLPLFSWLALTSFWQHLLLLCTSPTTNVSVWPNQIVSNNWQSSTEHFLSDVPSFVRPIQLGQDITCISCWSFCTNPKAFVTLLLCSSVFPIVVYVGELQQESNKYFSF